MKHSLSDGSGYLEIDHRDSPGLSADDIAKAPPGTLQAPGGTRLERDIQQCSHCQRGVVLNPGRVRARAVCQYCYHYVCDGCAVMVATTGACVPFKAVLDRVHVLQDTFSGQPDHPELAVGLDELMAQPTELMVVVP